MIPILPLFRTLRTWLSLLIALQLLPGSCAWCQPFKNGIRNGALANATTGLPFAGPGFPNPANVGYSRSGSLSVYAVQMYGIAALRYGGVHLSLPLRTSMLSFHASSFGFDTYRETQVQAGMVLPFKPGSAREIKFALHGTVKHLAIQRYGRTSSYSLSLGTSMPLSHNLYFGVAALHFLQTARLDVLPKTLTAGFSFKPFPAGSIMLAWAQTAQYSPSLKLGFEVKGNPFLQLRYGFSTQPLLYALGRGIQLDLLSIDLAMSYHQSLGWTPGVSINLLFMRRKDESQGVN